MKKIKCGEASGVACEFEAAGETAGEAVNKLLDHIREKHPDKLDKLPEKDKRKMMGAIYGMVKDA